MSIIKKFETAALAPTTWTNKNVYNRLKQRFKKQKPPNQSLMLHTIFLIIEFFQDFGFLPVEHKSCNIDFEIQL